MAQSSATLAWLSGFIRGLLRAAPMHVQASVLTSLCSQICQIVAFLLPLKVMILIGSATVPSYFPGFFISVERERLILLLSALAVLLYLAHLLMDFIGVSLAQKASKKLILQPCEDDALERQRKVALSVYRAAIVMLSGVLLALGVMVFLGMFNYPLLFVVLGYFSAVCLGAMLLFSLFPAWLEKVPSPLPRLIDTLSGCGFLLVFAVLVASFLYGDAEGLLLGILTLLLCRQMFSRLAMALKSFVQLYIHREKSALAFGGWQTEALESEEGDEEALANLLEGAPELAAPQKRKIIRPEVSPNAFRDLISPDSAWGWIDKALVEAGVNYDEIQVKQLEVQRRGELALEIRCVVSDSEDRYFLFKIFNKVLSSELRRSAELLDCYAGAEAIDLLAVIDCDSCSAHLYQWAAEAVQVTDAHLFQHFYEQAFIEFCTWPVNAHLRGLTLASTLAQRCSPSLWARCMAFSRWLDEGTRSLVEGFDNDPLRLRYALKSLPKYLYNPDIKAGNLYLLDGDLKVLNWEHWTLEPMGCGWPLEWGWARLEQVFEQACERNDKLRELSFAQLQLAALAFAFEARCAQGLYLSAFQLLPELRATLDVVDC